MNPSLKRKEFINIGIIAHVDAGKTTITENILHLTGRIKTVGSVDKGTAVTDSLDIERERGISVKSASVSVDWNDITINLIDTPGHIDFSAEVDRTLLSLDCAILVISAVEGVQAHTENLWSALKKLMIPALVFINKVDRIGSNVKSVLDEIRKDLSPDIFFLESITNEESENVVLDSSILQFFTDSSIDKKQIDLNSSDFEQIISADDTLTEKYLNEEKIEKSDLKAVLVNSINRRGLFPILFGSAKYNLGIKELLNAVSTILPITIDTDLDKEKLSGIVYRVEYDKVLGKLANVRLFSGNIKNRDLVKYGNQGYENKVTQIKKTYTKRLENIDFLIANDTAILCGLENVIAGDIIGEIKDNHFLEEKLQLFKDTGLSEPLLTVKLEPKVDSDYSSLVSAMKELSDEDPTLNFLWLKDERELHIKIMGKIQVEILENIFQSRFNICVVFGEPIVIYKETPAKIGEGYEEYTMPKPCWGVVRFKIEPLENGTGVIYDSKVNVDKIAAKYQNEIKATVLNEALNQGIHGWEVTDLKITLIDGEDHVIHSRPGDFILATKLALMDGLLNSTGSTLLEPILSFKITAPEESSGKVISSLIAIRAEIGSPETLENKIIINGKVPVSSSLDYLNTLNSITGGKGKFKSSFHSYKEVSLELGKTVPFRGISPKDRSKYIMKHRGAIQ